MEVAVASAVAVAVVPNAADAVVATIFVECVARNEAVASSTNSVIDRILFFSIEFAK